MEVSFGYLQKYIHIFVFFILACPILFYKLFSVKNLENKICLVKFDIGVAWYEFVTLQTYCKICFDEIIGIWDKCIIVPFPIYKVKFIFRTHLNSFIMSSNCFSVLQLFCMQQGLLSYINQVICYGINCYTNPHFGPHL